MKNQIQIKQHNLPHWTKPGSVYWITFRLADSIPQKKADVWKSERDKWMKLHPRPWSGKTISEYQRFFANTIDKWLDAGYGSQLLKRNDFRSIVKKCLMRFEGDRLRIHTAVIMPTHVHTLLEPFDAQKLPMIMKGIKGASARGANQILGRNGAFWAEESYDHIVRSQSEYDHYCRYVTENPIKSRLRQDESWLMPKRNDIRFSERNL